MSIVQNSTPYPRVPLGEIATDTRREVELIPGVAYRSLGVKWYGEGSYVYETQQGQEFEAARFAVRTDDLIYNDMWARRGSVAIVPSQLDGAVASSHFPTFTLDLTRVHPTYLRYYFRTPTFWSACEDASQGSTGRNQIKRSTFLALTIPLPPLAEQRRIVARVEGVAAKLAEARRLRVEAVGEAEALWEVSARCILKSTPTDTPSLGSVVSIQGGGTPTKSNPFFWEGPIPWVSPKDMKSREIFDATDHISEDAVQQSPAKLLEPNTVLVVVRGMILAHTVPAAILRVPAAINQDMKALTSNGQILPEYLCHVLWGFNDQILSLVEKSTHDTRKLETTKLLDFCIPLPSLPEQRRIVAELNALQAKVDALRALQAETATDLDALLPAVLDRAFRGDL